MRGTQSSSAAPNARPSPSRLRLSIGRHPRDLIQTIVAGALLTLCVLAALAPANPVEVVIFEQVGRLPQASAPVWFVLSWFGSWVAIAAVTVIALYFKWIRVGLLCAAAGALTWGPAQMMHWALGRRPVPPWMPEPPPGFLFPAVDVAVVAALVVIIAPYVTRRARPIGWSLVVLVAIADVYLGGNLPLCVVGGAFLGWGVGSLLHIVFGAPGRKISEEIVRRELESADLTPQAVVPVKYRVFEPRDFAVTTEDGQTFRVAVVRRMRRRAGFWHKMIRMLAVLEVHDEPTISTPHHEVEHEAYISLLAERAGVRTPPVVLVCDVKHAPPLLVRREINGRRLTQLSYDEVDDELLEAIWAQIAALGQAGLVHRDLRAKNILIDSERRPWLLNFTFGQAGASAALRALDLAEALVSMASVAGVDRALATAVRVLPTDALEAALADLVPLAVPRRIRLQTERGRFLLAELREALAEQIQRPIPGFRLRVRPVTVIGLLLIGAGVYLLLPELSSMGEVLDAIQHSNWAWLVAAVGFGLLAIVMSTISLLGSSTIPLPFWRTLAVQVAAAFTGRTTPAGAGFFGINLVFLERLGLRRGVAVGITLLNQAAMGAVAVLLCIVGAFGAGMTGTFGTLSIPTGWPVLLSVAGILMLIGIIVGLPFGRRRIVQPSLRVARELLEVLRHPVRATQLCGGSLGYLLTSSLGLAACLAAFHTEFSLLAVVLVFVLGNTLGHLAPSPGGLGAVEAALIAGLGATGVSPTASVAAVLTSRLLTYWLPVLPGIAAFRYLQHRGVI